MLLALLSPALACSCGCIGATTAESCLGSQLAFAGTIQGYTWPHPLTPGPASPRVEIAVDQVWAGELPSTVMAWTGYGCCDCTIRPAPGTRIVVCNDGLGGETFRLSACCAPALGERAAQVEADLGPGRPPGPRRVHPTVDDALDAVVISAHTALLWVPVALACLSAAIAGLRPAIPARASWAVVVTTLVIASACGARAIHGHFDESTLAYALPYALACFTAWVAAYGAQRRPGAFGGRGPALMAGVLAPVVVLWLGYGRAHVPVDLPGAVACSLARADAVLAQHDLLAQTALSELPNTCMDWGLQAFDVQASASGVCLSFDDGEGGRWVTCRDADGVRRDYRWDGAF